MSTPGDTRRDDGRPDAGRPDAGAPTPNDALSARGSAVAPQRGARSTPVRILRVAVLVALPVLAAVVAWRVTRDAPPPTPDDGHAGHAGMAMGGATGDSARHVTLTPDQAQRIGVTFAPVTASLLPREIRTVGQVTVDETTVQTVSLKIDGWVEQLAIDYVGRRVARGEPMMRLYSPMLVTAQEELLLARSLAADVAGGTADARASADDLLTSARRRLSYWDVAADVIAEIERSGQVQRTIPFSATATGVVVEKNVTVGQRVMAGEALLRVADLGTVWIEGDIYEQDLRTIRIGQTASVELDAYPGEAWRGRISYLYPTLNPDTRTARVRIALANPGRRLMPGMYATLRIAGVAGGSAGAVLSVPRGAVLATGERRIVFVKLPDGRLEPREVAIGTASDDRIEILRGVSLGDTVVASATFLIDAESNLGTALGGMGNMPGMEITTPPRGTPAPRKED